MLDFRSEIKKLLTNIIHLNLSRIFPEKTPPDNFNKNILVEKPQRLEHGDFASGISMMLARIYKNPPRSIAEYIKKEIESKNPDFISKVEVAGAGYLNFFLNNKIWKKILAEIVHLDNDYGKSSNEHKMNIQIEFVSANPTGPMNVVNARAAALGDTLANFLKIAGHNVTKEYYINDSGVQINNLGLSVEARMRELLGEIVEFPENGYHGDYIKDISEKLLKYIGKDIWDKEPEKRLNIIKEKSLNMMVADQKNQLKNYGVTYDIWFSERSLHEKKALENTLDILGEKDRTFKKDGALWLKTSDFGDEKDRVLVKEDGQPTYFLGDIAYHIDKFERNFDLIIDILGPDHHGHGIRMKAAMEALGFDPDKLMILIAQQVNLKKDGRNIKMSKRAGEFVTLDELVQEVGKDAARFFFLMRKAESHLDFDIDLAKKTSNDNPVYYIQYAYARISSILKKAMEQGIVIDDHPDDSVLSKLDLQNEIEIIKKLYDYRDMIDKCVILYEPQRISTYLIELAGMFHSYYNANRIISDDPDLTSARLYMVRGIIVVLRNALTIMGINTPESM